MKIGSEIKSIDDVHDLRQKKERSMCVCVCVVNTSYGMCGDKKIWARKKREENDVSKSVFFCFT